MTATAAELIRDSLVLAQVISEEDEYDSRYVKRGLKILNRTLAQWGRLSVYVPVINFLSFPLFANKFRYRVSASPQADVQSKYIIEITEGNVRFDTQGPVKNILKVASYANNNQFEYDIVKGVPRKVFLHKQNGFCDLYFYPTPCQAFTCTLTVKQALGEITLYEETLNIPTEWETPLIYTVANHMANWYGQKLPPQFYAEYREQQSFIESASVKDLAVMPDLSASNAEGYNDGLAVFWGGDFG